MTCLRALDPFVFPFFSTNFLPCNLAESGNSVFLRPVFMVAPYKSEGLTFLGVSHRYFLLMSLSTKESTHSPQTPRPSASVARVSRNQIPWRPKIRPGATAFFAMCSPGCSLARFSSFPFEKNSFPTRFQTVYLFGDHLTQPKKKYEARRNGRIAGLTCLFPPRALIGRGEPVTASNHSSWFP